MELRDQVSKLLALAAKSRVSVAEQQALWRSKAMLDAGESFGDVARSIPSMRYTKGLVMALDWAAEVEETHNPEWKVEAVGEFKRFATWYEELL